MTSGMKTIIYPVKDLAKAKALYGVLLGAAPVMDAAYYVQFNVDGQEVGLNPNGHSQGMTGPVCYWHVDDIEKVVKQLVETGAEVTQEIKEVGPTRLIASVRDADGNVIGLVQQS